MRKLEESLLAVVSERLHAVSKWRSRYYQRRQGRGVLSRVDENDTDTSRINGSVSYQTVVDEVARIVTSTLAIDEVYEQFAGEVKKLVAFDRIVIHVIDEHAGTSTVKYRSGIGPPGSDIGTVRRLQDIRSCELVSTGKTVVVNDLTVAPEFPLDQQYFEAGLNSLIVVPLFSRNRVVGAISLRSRQIGAYAKREQKILERLAKQISPALENAQLYEQARNAEKAAQERAEELSVLFDVASVLSKPGDFLEKATSVMEQLARVAEVEWATLRLPDQDGNLVLLVAAGSAIHRSPPMPVLSDRENLAYAAFLESRPIVANDYIAGGKPSPAIVELGMKSMVLLPLKAGGQTLGLINLVSKQTNHFTPELIKLLTAVGEGVGALLGNANLSQELQANVQEMAAVDEIARIISSTLDIDQVYDQFANEVKKLVHFDRMAITIIEPGGEEFVVKYSYGEELAGRRKGDAGPVQGSQVQLVAETGETLVRGNIADSPIWPMDQAALKAGLPSLTMVPLVSEGRVIGSFGLRSSITNPHGSRERVILERLARQIAPAIENARLFEASQRAESENAVMAEIGKVISSSLNIEEVYQRFSAEVGKLLPCDRIVIRLLDEDQSHTNISYLDGIEVADHESREAIPVAGRTQIEEVLRTREPSLIQLDDGAELEQYPILVPPFKVGLRSFLVVPLVSKDKTIGVLMVRSLKRDAYSEYHVDLLVRVGNQIAGAIANAQLYEARKQAEEEERRAAEENGLLAEIGRIISSSLAIDEIYERFANEVRKLIPFDRIVVSLIDLEHDEFSPAYMIGTKVEGREVGDIVPMTDSTTGEVVHKREPLLLRPGIDEGLLDRLPFIALAMKEGLRSLIATPLISQDQVVGSLQMHSTEREYTERDLALLGTVGNQIAGAIANSQLYEARKRAEEQERRAADENKALAEIGRIASSSLDIEEVYERLSGGVQKLVPFDRMVVSVLDKDGVTLSPTWATGTAIPGQVTSDVKTLAGSLTGKVAFTRAATIIEAENESDLGQFPGLLPGFRAGLKSCLAVPLIHRDVVSGVLLLRSKQRRKYSQHHLNLAEQIGNQIAGAIANAQLHAQTRRAEEAERQRSEELGGLLEVASILAQPGSFEDKVSRVVENLARISDSDSASLRVMEEEGLRRIGSAGEVPEGTTLVPYEGNIPALVYDQKEILVVTDYPNHPLAVVGWVQRSIKSLLAAPILSKGSVVAVVTVNSHETNHFTPERVSLVLGIINGLGTLLESARLEDERKQTEERIQETARLASIGELAAGVAHEINNPLTSVLGYSEMVLNNELSNEVLGDIQTIYDEAQRAAKIVQNLLFFARRSDTEKQYLNLNSVLNRSLEMKSYDFKVSNIEVISHLPPENPNTMIDEHQLVQVFLNILTNAEQAIQKAGGKGQIKVCTANSGDEIEITINDDGPGIPIEHLHKIFEPFFTTKEVGQGTGLGLSISYGIIKQHGGDIWAESVEGEGTTFHITLPVAVPEELAVSQLPALVSNGRSTKHLLVVDDEPHIRNLLRKYLELERYTVDLAIDGNDAWRKIQAVDYDCILLDLKMPGMSGQLLYQLIEELDESLARKVVFVTGDTVNPAVDVFVSQKSNPLITKPFAMEALLIKINELSEA